MRHLLLFFLLLCVGLLAAPQAWSEPPTGQTRVHRVKQGETLFSIAQRYRIPGGHKALARLNGIKDPGALAADQGILIPRYAFGAQDLPLYEPLRPAPGAWKPCKAERWPEPLPQVYPGCSDGECTCSPSDRDHCVCRCYDYSNKGFVQLRKNKPALRWGVGEGVREERGGFQVRGVEMDGEGEQEVVVGFRAEVSNGAAVETWNLAVLTEGGPQPLMMTTNSHGDHSLIQASQGTRCDLLHLQPRGLLFPLEGYKNAITGRRMRLKRGEFLPADSWRVRRHMTRDTDLGADLLGGPLVTLDPPDTTLGASTPPPMVGDIEAVTVDPHGLYAGTLRFKIRLRGSGELLDIPYDYQAFVEGGQSLRSYQLLGIGQEPLPEGYLPADRGASWIGRRVWLEVRDGLYFPGGGKALLLWIQGRADSAKP